MPNVEHIGISRRISDEVERTRLRTILEEIKPKGYGLIIRTASEGSEDKDLIKELEFLLLLWETVQKKKDRVSAPTMHYSDLDLVFRSVRDLMVQDVKRLVVDSADEYERIKDFVRTYFENLLGKIELYEGTEPIFDSFGIDPAWTSWAWRAGVRSPSEMPKSTGDRASARVATAISSGRTPTRQS